MNIQTRATGEAVASHKPSDYAVVYCTVPNQEVARSISSMLVEKSLAACVNTIAGVESTYWYLLWIKIANYRWEGKVERDQEQLLIIKTKSSLVPRIAGEIRASHPYDLPEVISLPIQGGLQGIWLALVIYKVTL
eukprot:jgi/Galph1/1348/GphlegSOOS_G6096.1